MFTASLAAAALVPPPAAGAGDFFGICVFIALLVFGGIASAIKKAKEQQEAEKMRQLLQQQWKQPRPGAAPVGGDRGDDIPMADVAPPAAGGASGVAALRAALRQAPPPDPQTTTRKTVSFDEWSAQRSAEKTQKREPGARLVDASDRISDAPSPPPPAAAPAAQTRHAQPLPERRLSDAPPTAAQAAAQARRAPIAISGAGPDLMGLLPSYLNEVQKAVVLAEIFPPRMGPLRRRR